MRDKALYFPYISLPNEMWTIKTLLYWDGLSSIVPMDYIDHPEELGPFMEQLVGEGLVEQVFPTQYLYQIDLFEQCFIDLIKKRSDWRLMSTAGVARGGTAKTRIHIEKMGRISDFLVEYGLAERVNWAWYDVDKRVANLFMAYLASCLGAIPAINAAPVTDKVAFSRMFGDLKRPYKRDNAIHHHKARDVILKSLLPAPSEQVTLSQLVRFKQRHGHLLPALRRKVEAHCASIAILENPEDRIVSTEDFVKQSRLEIDEIVDAMKPTWKMLTFGSLIPLFGSGLAWQATETGNHLAYAGAALSFAGATYQAIASIQGIQNQQLTKPLAYLAHARSSIYA